MYGVCVCARVVRWSSVLLIDKGFGNKDARTSPLISKDDEVKESYVDILEGIPDLSGSTPLGEKMQDL